MITIATYMPMPQYYGNRIENVGIFVQHNSLCPNVSTHETNSFMVQNIFMYKILLC